MEQQHTHPRFHYEQMQQLPATKRLLFRTTGIEGLHLYRTRMRTEVLLTCVVLFTAVATVSAHPHAYANLTCEDDPEIYSYHLHGEVTVIVNVSGVASISLVC